MIIVLINWILVAFVCLSLGQVTVDVAVKTLVGEESKSTDIPSFMLFLLGLSLTAFIGNIFSVFLNIDWKLFLGLLVFSIIYQGLNLRTTIRLIKRRINKLRNTPVFILPIFILILLNALIRSSGGVTNVDHWGYYIPYIKWIENYPLTDGIALLNGRFGFNTSYHLCAAVFGQTSVIDLGLYDLNGLIFCFLNIWSIYKLSVCIQNKDVKMANFFLPIALLFPFAFLIDSIDADFLIIYGSLFILYSYMNAELKNSEMDKLHLFVSFLIIVFLTTNKPLCGLLLFFPLQHIIKARSYKFLFSLVGVSMVYYTPWLYRNVHLSGYLVFPIYHLDFFDVEWKLPKAYVRNMLAVVKEFAQVSKIHQSYFYEEVSLYSLVEWFPIWIENNLKTALGKFVILLLPFAFVSFVLKLILRKANNTQLFSVILIFIIIVWLLLFPALRFGWPFVIAFIFLQFISFFKSYFKGRGTLLAYAVIALYTISLVRTTYNSIIQRPSFTEVWLKPEKERSDFRFTLISNGKIKKSDSEYCGALYPPCMPVHNTFKVLKTEKGFVLDQ